jgi:hypothetical protein
MQWLICASGSRVLREGERCGEHHKSCVQSPVGAEQSERVHQDNYRQAGTRP